MLEFLSVEVTQLHSGIEMDMFDEPEPQRIYADLINDCLDTPASCKFAGLAGHAPAKHPCHWCHIKLDKLLTLKAYDHKNLRLKDDMELLRASFQSQYAGIAHCEVILNQSGSGMAAKHEVHIRLYALYFSGWVFSQFQLVGSNFWNELILHAYMLSSPGAKDHFESFINSVRWPSHIGQLPKNLGENQSLKKADE
ncbi:hypothetical protein K439DRAFT_1622994 [Ramaria rubella]|nr:hypothetical protein K439DRAFT_1622994 [Ramaria rubella]